MFVSPLEEKVDQVEVYAGVHHGGSNCFITFAR
jgi:hypothetical protein